MSDLWYTSDIHVGHTLMAELRGFDSVEEHDEELLRRWNAIIEKRDVVWILGDLSLNMNTGIEWIKRAKGIKYLVAGNHDACHPIHKDWAAKTRRYVESAFHGVTTMAMHDLAGEKVMLSHFPYEVDRVPASRFMEWRLRDEGRWLLHGHTHLPERLSGERQIHVGLDAWGSYPVHRDTISDWMEQGYA